MLIPLQTVKANARAAVKRGASYLDAIAPGWAMKPSATYVTAAEHEFVPPPGGATYTPYWVDPDQIDGAFYGFYPAFGPLGEARPQAMGDPVALPSAWVDTLEGEWDRARRRRVYLKALRARRKAGQTPGTALDGRRGTFVKSPKLTVKIGPVLQPPKKKETSRAKRRTLVTDIVL